MTRFFWDTNVFIYLLDAQGTWNEAARSLRSTMKQHGIQLVTSTMTLGELQVGPRKAGDSGTADRYRHAVGKAATVVPFDQSAADHYAAIRSTTSVRGPDAIQLACAASHGVELFVTNDTRLHKVRYPGIHFIVSMATAIQLAQ
jgi:uncharacterized protein